MTSKAVFECTKIVHESMYTLAARIEDADYAQEWLDSCRESYSVRQPGQPAPRPNRREFEVYERLKGLPAFHISDRDVFLKGTWHRRANGLVCHLRPSNHPQDASRPGVVRMPNLQGCFALRPHGSDATMVTYSLDVDLGGSVPEFITRRAVKEIPAKTLEGLERAAQTGHSDYEAAGRELKAALTSDADNDDGCLT